METRGAIYHHKKLVFQNGHIGKKYLILLNSPSKNEPYLFVKTTSQKKDKPTTPGCIKQRSLFFIPAGKSFFKLDTWVQLYEIYPISPKDIDTNKDITIEESLNVKIIDDIVNLRLKKIISPQFLKNCYARLSLMPCLNLKKSTIKTINQNIPNWGLIF